MAMRRERTKHRTSPMAGGLSLQLDKRKGQHLLKNAGILDKIVSAADIKSSDIVLEVGPGTGNLTMRILPLCKRVLAFDVDGRMVNEVKKRAFSVGYTNLEAREQDALRGELPRFDVCTANLPYQISSPFVFRILAHRPAFRCAVLMFQKEFACRLMALPGDKNYCRLSVNTQLFSKVTKVCNVSPGSFNPPPKVESMVVKIVPRLVPFDVDFREWDGLLRICFHRKNKTLRAAFKKTTVLNMLESNYKTWCSLNKVAPEVIDMKEFVLGIVEEADMTAQRSMQLSIDDFFQLLLAFNKRGIHFVNVAQQPGKAADMDWASLAAMAEGSMDD